MGILASSRPLSQGESFALAGEGSAQYLSHSFHLSDLDWTYRFLIPRDALTHDSMLTLYIGLSLLLLMATLIVLMLIRTIGSISGPIKRMASDLACIGKGKYTLIRPAQIREFALLSDTINTMLRDIETSHENERKNQELLSAMANEQERAWLFAYRNQINPHFLFNALEKLRSMAHHYGASPLEEQVQALSHVFRNLLDMEVFVRLEDELRSAHGYYVICRQWAQESVDLRVRADDEARACTVLSLTLQPIFENALVHAFPAGSPDRRKIIDIFAEKKMSGAEEALVIRVTDNGAGIDEEELAALREKLRDTSASLPSDHIGLANIQRRLRLVYGEDSRILLRSVAGRYTQVTIRLPLRATYRPVVSGRASGIPPA